MAIRWCVLSLTLPLVCQGQFTSMSTDFTGRTLFFTTELSQSGSGQPRYGKVFLADDEGVRLLGLRDREVVSTYIRPPDLPIQITNYFDLDGVDMASNGSHLSVMGLRDCNDSSSSCGYGAGSSIYDPNGKEILKAPGRLILSPNGKWALGVADLLSGPLSYYTRYDIEGGKEERIRFDRSQSWRAHDIANNGTVVLTLPVSIATLSLFPLSGPPQAVAQYEPGLPSFAIQSAVIDAEARIVVWEQRDLNDVPNLFLVRTSDLGQRVRLADNGFRPRISDDGATVLYLSRTRNEDQVFVIRVEGGAARQVTTEADGVATVVLSGDGRVAWVQTKSGQLLKFDLENGNRREFTDRLPSWLLHSDVRRTRQIAYGTPGAVLRLPAW